FLAAAKRIFEITNTITVVNELTLSGTGNLHLNTGTIDLVNSANLIAGNTGTSGGGDALIQFTGSGPQNLFGSANAEENKLPRILVDKTSGTVAFHNTVNISNQFTNTTGIDAITNYSNVVFSNGNTGLQGGIINQYTINGNTSFYNLEFAATTNSVFDLGF